MLYYQPKIYYTNLTIKSIIYRLASKIILFSMFMESKSINVLVLHKELQTYPIVESFKNYC